MPCIAAIFGVTLVSIDSMFFLLGMNEFSLAMEKDVKLLMPVLRCLV